MPEIDPEEVEHIPPEAASTYAKLAERYGREYYESVADAVASQLSAGDRLIDAGTGPGFLPLAVAERTTDVTIDAFDYTRALVEYGHDRAADRGLYSRLSFFVADCYSIPVLDGSYSFLTCTGVLHSLDRPVDALTEFYRVLEPGGNAWVFDPAIIDIPNEPDVAFTPHECEVFRAYGVRTRDETPPMSQREAESLVEASPFETGRIDTGDEGDVRIRLTRRE